MKRIKLNQTQREIVLHRLESDAVVDVLIEDGWSEGKATRQVAYVKQQVADHRTLVLSDDELEILAECLEGCTYFADAEDAISTGETTRRRVNAEIRAAQDLAEELSQLLGRTVAAVLS